MGTMTKVADLGWLPDPTGRYEYRYWDGSDWSDDVYDDGLMFRDPMATGKLPPPLERSRRWAPRFALLGAGMLLAAGTAATVALVVVPRDGRDTETAGQARAGGTTTTAPSTSSSTTTPSTTAAPAAPGPATGPAASGGLPDSVTSTTAPAAPPPAGGEAPADPDAAAVAENLAGGLMAAGGGMLNEDQAQCLAEAMVEALGVDRIRELGMESGNIVAMSTGFSQLTPEESAAMSDLQSTCGM
jgi:hypothetical protein